MRLRLLFLTIFSFLIISSGFSQHEEPAGSIMADRPLQDRLYVGGNIGLSFGHYADYIEASPLIGYMLTDKWSAGVGASYIYTNNKFFGFKQNVYGGRLFTRYQILNFLFAHGEYEHLFTKVTDDVESFSDQYPGLLLGGGFSSLMGERSMFYAMILYNILHEPNNSIYPQAYVIRVGFNFGL